MKSISINGGFQSAKTWFAGLDTKMQYGVYASGVIAVLLGSYLIFGGTITSSAGNTVDVRFVSSDADPALAAKQAEFRAQVIDSFAKQVGVNAELQQKIEFLSKAKTVDPKVIESIQNDILALKKLYDSNTAKVSDMETKQKTIVDKLSSLLSSSAYASAPGVQVAQTTTAPSSSLPPAFELSKWKSYDGSERLGLMQLSCNKDENDFGPKAMVMKKLMKLEESDAAIITKSCNPLDIDRRIAIAAGNATDSVQKPVRVVSSESCPSGLNSAGRFGCLKMSW